ncbi:MAG: anaerobic ribonucleoside-triphosphate reductase activating protein [Deltaproteobacteria bacterium]|nr:anaerobic ribonucleoside-triphosphate reductase activating protein [Deltaproteobacteria bacterium]
MNIAGLTPFSSIDFEGRLSAVVYTQGCNFNCIYCHNYQLIKRKNTPLSLESLFEFIKLRKRILDSVVISGGEPTLHKDLPNFCERLKNLGLSVKIDTNGTSPLMLNLLTSKGLIDYIAMDIKAPFHKYKEIIKTEFPTEIIKTSMEFIKSSNIPHEFRTTVHSELLSLSDLEEIIQLVGSKHKLYFQIANPTPLFKVPNRYTRETLNAFISKFPDFRLAIR